MRKAQITAITNLGIDKTIKIIDETTDNPPEIFIYAQVNRGESILEYSVNASGTIGHIATYGWSKEQQ